MSLKSGRTKFGVRQPGSRGKHGLADPTLVGDVDPTRKPYPTNPPADRDAERLAEQRRRKAERKNQRAQGRRDAGMA